VLVAGASGFTKEVGCLVGYLQVGGLSSDLEFGHNALDDLPYLAALSLGQRSTPPRPQAGEVRLLGVQVLGEDDLFPFVLEEDRTEREARIDRRGRPPAPLVSHVRDVRLTPSFPDDPVRQPIDVEYLHPASRFLVFDQDGQLAFERLGQALGEGGQQDRWLASGRQV